MPTSSAGKITKEFVTAPFGHGSLTMSRDHRERFKKIVLTRGVTLLEMMIVVTIIAVVAGISFPSVAAGVDTLRLRSASDSIVAFLNTALDHADRRQQAVEIWISPHENALSVQSADHVFNRRLEIPEPVHITAVLPLAPLNPDEPRRFLLYPGGSIPRIGIEIALASGRKRMVSVDPITGVTRSEIEK
jgi:prepilin-type N-terminal cleavage/methylation domain-containing protein